MKAVGIGLLAIASLCACPKSMADNAIPVGGDSILVSEERDNQIMLFKRSAQRPDWRIPTVRGNWPQSNVATLAQLADGRILLVERGGRIRLIGSGGEIIDEKRPRYEFVKLSVAFEDMDSTNWPDQVEYVGTTSAAFVSGDKRHLYLVANRWSIPRKVTIDKVLGFQSELLTLTNGLVFMYKDENLTMWHRLDDESVPIERQWIPGNNTLAATALASCGDQLIVGTSDGFVYFVNEQGDGSDFRPRQISKAGDHVAVLDAGCLAKNLAYTVSHDAGNQILLWDLKTKTAVSTARAGKGGHPGTALLGVAGASGDRLLTLGDFDVRLWSVEDRVLKLVARYYPGTKEAIRSGAALSSGDFVFWDSATLWTVPKTGAVAQYYAGAPGRTMESCDDGGSVRCWSAK